MTWTEFKTLIDKQLKAQGVPEDAPVWYIDVHMPMEGIEPESGYSEDEGIWIS